MGYQDLRPSSLVAPARDCVGFSPIRDTTPAGRYYRCVL